jgi:O-antigen/teichoic acid export membrane protein
VRSENSMKNIIVNTVGQLTSTLVSFICRIVFVWTLGKEYLGVSSLFTNILTLFSVAELGIGFAINFSMYKPLAQNDRKKVGALMGLYKRAYHIIGLIVAIAGLALAPFYRFFINTPSDIPNLTLIYFMYLFSSVLTYFFSYKQAIINADQKNYVCTVYQYGFSMAQNVVQIVILFVTKNFILYLSMQVLFSFLTNFFLARKADKMYPYLNHYKDEKLSQVDRTSIFKNIKAMFLNKIGGSVINGTDTILMSKFFGLAAVGIYSNYLLITTTLVGIISQAFNAVLASVGNLGAVENHRKSFNIYLAINFAGFWIFSFSSISLFCLFNPFIGQLLGKTLLFPVSVVFFIVLNFYATGMRQATLLFKNAFGLFWYDRYKAIIEATVNLAASIILSKYVGVAGIFIGTFISTITIDFWVEPLVLFRHGFHRSMAPYFLRYALYTSLTFAVGFLTWYCCSLVGGPALLSFAVKCMICLIIPNSLYLLVFYRTKEFQYLKGLIRLPAFLKRK